MTFGYCGERDPVTEAGLQQGEEGAVVERGVSEAGDITFHTAHVGDDGALIDMRCDLMDERCNAIHGGGDYHEVGPAHSLCRGVGDGVAPRLFTDPQPRLGAARPHHHAARYATVMGCARHRTAQKAGGKDGEVKGHDSLQKTNPCRVERGCIANYRATPIRRQFAMPNSPIKFRKWKKRSAAVRWLSYRVRTRDRVTACLA